MLSIEASRNIKSRNGNPFRWDAHHIKEILAFFLKGIDLDGSSKIQITFGPPDDDSKRNYHKILNSSNYIIADFNFKEYDLLSESKKELAIFDNAIYSLKEISIINDRPDLFDFISEIEKKILGIEFNLDIEIKKLAKTDRVNGAKLSVHRILNRNIGEGWQCILKGVNKFEKIWMHEVPHYLDMTDIFKYSEYSNFKYSVFDRLGKERFSIHIPQAEIKTY